MGGPGGDTSIEVTGVDDPPTWSSDRAEPERASVTRRPAPRSRDRARSAAIADLGEQRDGALQVGHRVVVAAGVMEQVGEVVLDRGLEVTVADPTARLGGPSSPRASASSTAPPRASVSARAVIAAIEAVGSGSSAASGDAPLERSRGPRSRSPRDCATSPTIRCGERRQVRVADARPPGARGLGRRRAGGVEVARAQRDDAPLDERPRPERIGRLGRRQRGVEVAGRRAEVAPPPMDAPEGDLDRRAGRRLGRARRRSRGRRSPPGSRRVAPAARRSWRAPARRDRHAEGEGRLEVVDRLAIGVNRSRLGRPPRRMRRRPRPAGPPPARARRSGRTASGRRGRSPPDRAGARPPPAGGAAGGGRGSSPRRPRRASGRGRSRTAPTARRRPAPRGRCPRRIDSSSASTVSSSDRPLAARTVARSNERPMTAAADRTCVAVSPTDPSRSRSSAWTLRGIDDPGGSPLASASTTWSGSPSESAAKASMTGVVGACAGRTARTSSATASRDSRPRTTVVAVRQPGQIIDGRARRSASRSSRRQARSSRTGRPAEPPSQVREGLARRLVGEVEVVDPDEARHRRPVASAVKARRRWPRGGGRGRPAASGASDAAAAGGAKLAGRSTRRPSSAARRLVQRRQPSRAVRESRGPRAGDSAIGP